MAEHGGLVNFKSSRVYEAKKEIKRQAREQLLAKTKEKYEKEERRKERKRRTGEDVWMLPAVNDRLAAEEESLKPKKHKKEKKKHKKHKKEKKRKRNDSSSGSEVSDSEVQWVESSSAGPSVDSTSSTAAASAVPGQAETQTAVTDEPVKRDDWMMASFDLVPTVTQKELKQQRKEERDKEKEKNKNLSCVDAPGQHERELNPYWKGGGTGLPEEAPSKKEAPKQTAGVFDGGAGWLKRQYQRAQEQAEEEGRDPEEIAEQRWGSLEKFQKMLADAEEKERGQRSPQGGERDRGHRSCSDRERQERWRKPASADRGSHGDRYRHERREMDRSYEKDRRSRKEPEEERRTHDHKEYDRDRDGSSRSEPRRYDSRKEEERDSKDSRKHDRNTHREKHTSSSRSNLKFSGLFKKPTEDHKDASSFSTWSKKASPEEKDRNEGVPAWKKKGFKKPDEDTASSAESKAVSGPERPSASSIPRAGGSGSNSSSAPSWKKKELQPTEQVREQESSSSESSSEEEEEDQDRSPSPPVRVLSEEEMNTLGARLVKAELMGNDELTARIKAQLEQARKAKQAQPKVPVRPEGRSSVRRGEEEEEVLLTRTDNTGRSWPLPEGPSQDTGKGRRRKNKKIETHDKSGTRQRYFEDDDQHDLASMAQLERRTTAADQNAMYARMAAKFSGKPDFTLDDMFESSAANKGTSKKAEERERQVAIAEHRRQATRLDKCRFCFENPEVPKHLIIAIGKKVYLTLPNVKSLTEGHCLLVPMQHVNSGTTMDEDVWAEVQAFRRCLVQMFQADDDQDCVFMETAMRLGQFRHTAIECVPLPRELGDMAPIYFKKAIMEADVEWAQNKRLIDLKGRDVRKAVPKGLPYFSVDFGMQSGFAHVIEDEQIFPHYFGREILGGMLDLEPRFFRKPPKESFEDQRKKVLKFAEQWKPYDWTKNIGKAV